MTRDDILTMTFRQQLEAAGMTQAQCSRRFEIPLRTVQGWTLGERECPSYVRLMIAELTGALDDAPGRAEIHA